MIIARSLQVGVMIYLFLVPLFYMPTYGQTLDQDVLAPIPTLLRVRLKERLKLLVEYQRKQQWDKQYDLLSEVTVQGDSKKEFAKQLRLAYAQGLGNSLIDFIPKSVVVHDESMDTGWWTIYGCAKLHEKGRTAQLYASVDAYRKNDDWFFSQVGIITPIDGNAKRCP